MRAYGSVPVMLGSLVECPVCWCAVPRWRRDRHEQRHEEEDRRAVQLAALAEYVAAGERLAPSADVKAV